MKKIASKCYLSWSVKQQQEGISAQELLFTRDAWSWLPSMHRFLERAYCLHWLLSTLSRALGLLDVTSKKVWYPDTLLPKDSRVRLRKSHDRLTTIQPTIRWSWIRVRIRVRIRIRVRVKEVSDASWLNLVRGTVHPCDCAIDVINRCSKMKPFRKVKHSTFTNMQDYRQIFVNNVALFTRSAYRFKIHRRQVSWTFRDRPTELSRRDRG